MNPMLEDKLLKAAKDEIKNECLSNHLKKVDELLTMLSKEHAGINIEYLAIKLTETIEQYADKYSELSYTLSKTISGLVRAEIESLKQTSVAA